MNRDVEQPSFWAARCPIYAKMGSAVHVQRALSVHRGIIVTDANVALHQARFLDAFENVRWKRYIVPPGEKSKNQGILFDLLSFMSGNELHKDSWVIAVGGGVVSDISSLAAALFLRGIHIALFPTSFLAMADAAIGGKSAVDLGETKNAIGSIRAPDLICIDPEFLQSLPPSEIYNGFAEIVKTAIAVDSKFWNDLHSAPPLLDMCPLSELAALAIRTAHLKANIVSADENDCNIRTVLNLGHTFGHALESLSTFVLSHGQAIALGLIFALSLSEDWAGLAPGSAAKCAKLFRTLHMPLCWPSTLPVPSPLEFACALFRDKKCLSNGIHLVLCDRIGHALPATKLPFWEPCNWFSTWFSNHGRHYGFCDG